MFSIGSWEMMLFLGVIILLFGAPRIPALARSLGRSITEFKKGAAGIDDDSANLDKEETKSGSKSES